MRRPACPDSFISMASSDQTDLYDIQRAAMVEEQLRARGIRDQRVLEVMRRVPRHEFLAEEHRAQAYEDHPVPIGEGQTISQPYIVALMLEALQLEPTGRVLEVGSGSGYVTALLAELTTEVFSIERHGVLVAESRRVLQLLGYRNAHVSLGDGNLGIAEHAPYDAIVVSAAAGEVPPRLLAQTAEGGRMMIPVGPADTQQLQLIEIKNGEPQISLRELCRFVPLLDGVNHEHLQ
jgi:protein-L-isoaspartate(D-aspartate) O-methyltransferase